MVVGHLNAPNTFKIVCQLKDGQRVKTGTECPMCITPIVYQSRRAV